MAEYINREVALSLIQPDTPEDEKGAITIATAKKLVRSIVYRTPTADVAPVRHGRWLGWGKSGTPTYENYGTCSVCGEDAEIYTEHRNYCPNCGAQMDEKEG